MGRKADDSYLGQDHALPVNGPGVHLRNELVRREVNAAGRRDPTR